LVDLLYFLVNAFLWAHLIRGSLWRYLWNKKFSFFHAYEYLSTSYFSLIRLTKSRKGKKLKNKTEYDEVLGSVQINCIFCKKRHLNNCFAYQVRWSQTEVACLYWFLHSFEGIKTVRPSMKIAKDSLKLLFVATMLTSF